MNISEGKYVRLSYRLSENDAAGELLEETSNEEPFEIVFKQTPILEKFEQGILGKTVGEPFQVTIPHADAYGPYDPEMIAELEKSMFMVDGELDDDLFAVGEIVPLKDDQENEILAEVIEVSVNHITVDLNHPLAGVDLYFEGKVEEIREPSEEELASL